MKISTIHYNFFNRIISLFLIIFLLLSLVACNTTTGETEEVVFDVDVVTPIYENIEITGDFIGQVEADSQVMIIPKVAGDVTGVFFEVGDHVNAGDLLFTVDDAGLQIQLAQAQASLDSVRASVSSAEANVVLNDSNMIYTQAQIEQTLGTIGTNRMQLANAVAQAKYALQAAEGNVKIAKEQLGLAEDSLDKFDENIDDLLDNQDNMEDYADNLKGIRNAAFSIRGKPDIEAQQYIFAIFARKEDKSLDDWDNPQTPVGNMIKSTYTTASDCANYYVLQMTGGSAKDVDSLSVMISTAESTAENLGTQADNLKNNKDSLRVNVMQAALAVTAAKNNALTANDAKNLAERMLLDYDLYTRAVIITGTDYQRAGADTQMAAAQAGLAQANAGVRQAQAGVNSVLLQLDYTRVKSPVSGVVTQKNVTVNNLTSQQSPAFVINSDNENAVSFNVAETVMRTVNIGDNVVIERNGNKYTGIVTENAGFPDQTSGLFKIKARIEGEGGNNLIAGTTVKLSLVTRKAENAMVLPVDCVYYENHTPYVFTEVDGVAQKIIVETGLSDDKYIEIISGLDDTSKVITTWHSQLGDGSKVKTTLSGIQKVDE